MLWAKFIVFEPRETVTHAAAVRSCAVERGRFRSRTGETDGMNFQRLVAPHRHGLSQPEGTMGKQTDE